eukprot:2726506-Rhodomonas_salina.1
MSRTTVMATHATPVSSRNCNPHTLPQYPTSPTTSVPHFPYHTLAQYNCNAPTIPAQYRTRRQPANPYSVLDTA